MDGGMLVINLVAFLRWSLIHKALSPSLSSLLLLTDSKNPPGQADSPFSHMISRYTTRFLQSPTP